MKKNIIVVLTAIIVLLFSGIAICSALIPSNESLPSNTSFMTPEGEPYPFDVIIAEPYPTSSPAPEVFITPETEQLPLKQELYPTYPPYPTWTPYPTPYPTWTPYPTPYPTWTPYPTPYPTWTPTPTPISTSAPLEGQPSQTPQPSSGKTSSGDSVSNLPTPSGMATISEGEVAKIGGAPRKITMISGSQLWVLYNGAWTKNSAAIYYGAQTYILLYNDQGQGISTEETYPSSWVDKRYWGYLNPGYKYFTFIGDAVGWHKVVAKGSVTGQSNAIWVYVWPTTPTPPTPPPPTTFAVSAAWPSSSYYYIGSPTCIYFTVNKPCRARVTYIKQNSNIVWSGPSYVSAGTHTDAGTIGWPKGMRTVVVDAWTSSGEYDSAVTSYNVV